MVLEQVTEIWMEQPKTAKGQKKAKAVNRERWVMGKKIPEQRSMIVIHVKWIVRR